MSVGSKDQLKWLQEQLEKRFEVKTDIIGHADKDHKDEGKILNRFIKAEEWGCSVEADPRHAELLVEELGIERGLATPGVEENEVEEEKDLDYVGATRYRSLVARANYLATDRPDLCFAVKELCKTMSKPTDASWNKLMRVGKYLKKNPRLVLRFEHQDPVDELDVFSDANWAGCKATRKSTSGCIIRRGGHLIKAWSRNQNVIALSTAESEFHATVKGAVEGLGLVAMAQAFEDTYKVRLHVDASAALGIVQRKGVGKIRHLHTGSLWIQEHQGRNTVTFHKVKGTLNPADLFTKYLAREATEGYLKMMSAELKEGRSEKAADLHTLMRKKRQLKSQLNDKIKKNALSEEAKPGIALSVEPELELMALIDHQEKLRDEAFDHKFRHWLNDQCRQIGRQARSPVIARG